MFSLNSINTQNQILVNINQLAARYSCLFKQRKHSNGKNSNVKRKENAASLYDATLCSESLEEAVRNFDKNDLAEMRKIDLRSVATFSKAAKKPLNSIRELQSVRKVSFISAETFDKNKNGWTALSTATPTVTVDLRGPNTRVSFTDNFLGLLTRSLQTNTFLYNVQVRGFKTERGVHADLKRNPNLINRLRKFFGLNVSESEKQSNVGPEAAPRLEKLLTDEPVLTHQQKDKIKIAFAEGYLAGSHPDNVRGTKASKYLKFVQQLLTIVLFLAIFVSLMASVSGTVFRIQLGNQVEVDPEDISVTFDDVKGADEAKQELKDVVEFLKSPDKFSLLGGKLPKGVLLVGPPGTGKTLLARAVASQLDANFLKVVSSAIVDKYIGESARLIREMFNYARDHQPCIIFMDEIDAIGGRRFSEGTSADREIQRTLMELLNQMDGFDSLGQVKIIMATNRPDTLDPALLRPGRLDRKIEIPLPNEQARLEILKIHAAPIAKHGEMDYEAVVKLSDTFNGADLRNVCTEAGLFAIRAEREYIIQEDLMKAVRKVADNKKLETKLDYKPV